MLEVDGPDLHPTTIDTRAALDLANAFVQLLEKAAEAKGVALGLHGFQVIDKCHATMVRTQDPRAGAVVMEEVEILIIGGRVPPVKGLAPAADALRSALRKFGPGHTFKLAVGDWERVVEPRDSPEELMPQSVTTLRARLIRIGVSPPRARFESGAELEPFTLDVTREQALQWSRFLGQDVDIEVSIRRGVLDNIEDGYVIALHPMDENATPDSWLEWLTVNGRQWDDVEDHLTELGRNDD